MWPAEHDAASGAEGRPPPSGSHPNHWPLAYHLCHSWLSVPRTNASVLVPCAAEPGSAVTPPPSCCHRPHVVPFHARCHRPLSVPRTKTSVEAVPADASVPDVLMPSSDVHPLGRMPDAETVNVHVYGIKLTVSATVYVEPTTSGCLGTTITAPREVRLLPTDGLL